MIPLIRTILVSAISFPVLQLAGQPGFMHWTASDLESRNEVLAVDVSQDRNSILFGSSRATLMDYENPTGAHRIRHIRRETNGIPETHENIIDVVFIQSGEGAVLVGGEQVSEPGGNVGGTRYEVGAGDLLRIPARTTHSYLVPEGGHLTYVLVRVPELQAEPVVADDAPDLPFSPPGFAIWRASELQRRDAALAADVSQDPNSILYGSSRETLADFGNPTGAHRFRLIRRHTDGIPETHEEIVDIVFIQSGSGTVQVGGELVSEPGGNVGGTTAEIGPGDLLHIPARTPHSYLVPEDGHLTYVLYRLPAYDAPQ